MSLKHNIANTLRKHKYADSFFYRILWCMNSMFFHRHERQIKKSYGSKNPDCIFYVIRRFLTEEGLLSMYYGILRDIAYAQEKGYIPVVDLENSKTQYTTGKLINGTRNAWEYFWNQPSEYSLDEVYHSKNVILSGNDKKADEERKNTKLSSLLSRRDFQDEEVIHELYQFIKKHADIAPYIYEKAEHIYNEQFNNEKVMGVFLRGTDYTTFRPARHAVQPSKEYVYEKLLELKQRCPAEKVFLVTEDDGIYNFFKNKLGESLIEVEDIRFPQYKGDDYIFKYCKGNSYQVGLCYLVKLLLLSKCNYLIASIASGSTFANVMNDNHYEERVFIDLGVY